jgi:hypothetical protein
MHIYRWHEQYIKEAYELGREHAENAASWCINGFVAPNHVQQMVQWFDDGDPQLDDYLPRHPNLSGEFADDPTPLSLARDITGDDDIDPELMDELADAYEAGVDDTFYEACEREYRAAL